MNFPKISIVTPSYNDAEYLEQTILSIISQGYPNLEYIIIDGGSTDGSVEIIKKYEHHLKYWVSEKDNGMYHAIQKGMERTNGEVMGWLNSDDWHHPGSLFTIAEIFSAFANVNWIQGMPNVIDEKGRSVYATERRDVDKYFFYARNHISSRKYIQQESTFWRRTLWEKTGQYISQQYRYAGDFELWIRFFQHEKLYTLTALLGAFRLSSHGQASREHYQDYVNESLAILAKFPLTAHEKRAMRWLGVVAKLERFSSRIIGLLRRRIFKVPPSVYNRRIYFDGTIQKFRQR